jgi:uncharacterized protein with GYD domain
MPTCAVLTNFTKQGIKDVKASPDRFEGGQSLLAQMGIEIKAHYWLMGQYDLLTILEAPDDETVSRFVLTVGMQGNGRTETMRAFSLEAFKGIVQSLPKTWLGLTGIKELLYFPLTGM